MTTIETPRLRLIEATRAALNAELVGREALAEVLGVEVPESWPPPEYDADAVRWTLAALAEGRARDGFTLYYIVERATAEAPARLCGGGGFIGAPDGDGTVEIGYAIVPERQRRGYARETVEAWVDWAFTHPEVSRVIAHTLPDLAPSIRLLESAGFTYVGPEAAAGEADAIRYERRRSG